MKTTTLLSTLTNGARHTLLLATLIGLGGIVPASLQAETVSELLEQGVYSEETKGDLDAAMKLYQQIVKEARTGEAIAAEAQYRLGVCYYKKREFSKATAAFETLVKEYPEQEKLVRLASEYLAGAVALLPSPWTDGEEMHLSIQTATGFEIGFVRYTIYSDTVNGQKIWRLGSQLTAGAQQASQVEVVADSFKPLGSRWKHSLLGDAQATYSAGRAEVTLTGKDEVKTVDLNGVVFDNEQVIQLIRRLPLAPDYSTTLRVFSSLGAGVIIPFELKVTGQEKVEVPAGTFDCYKIDLSLVKQTFWYTADEHRHLVKFEAGPITAKLTRVEKRSAKEIAKNETTAFDFLLGQTGGGAPTVQEQNQQPTQNQAKLLILTTAKLGTIPKVTNWCDALNASGAKFPEVSKDTVFALNTAVAGRSLTDIPSDTVVFFETANRGWNQSGGRELLAKKSTGVAVAFADGRALLVDPTQSENLRWNP